MQGVGRETSGRRCRHFCGKKNFRGTDFIPTTKKEPEDQVMLNRERVCISKLGNFFFFARLKD